MKLRIDAKLKNDYPDMYVLSSFIKNVRVKRTKKSLEVFKEKVYQRIRESHDLQSLKNEPNIRAYRDFFWKIGIDPTKIRLAAEALIRRILLGKKIPTINNVLDSYNLASIELKVALAVFDRKKIIGDLIMRYSHPGELFQGIGMKDSRQFKGNEVIISDDEKLVAIYLYRDADTSKIEESTRDVLLLVCGVPKIEKPILLNAKKIAVNLITRYCSVENFPNNI